MTEPTEGKDVDEGLIQGTTGRSRLELEAYIGTRIRQERRGQGLKIADVARITGISQGMVSKIENAQVSTSLDTLSRLCEAIGLPLSRLFTDYDQTGSAAQLVRADEGMEVVGRGTDKGHTYRLLAHRRGPRQNFEPFLVTLDDASEVFPTFSHPGTEFLHFLEGRMVYRVGNELFEVGPGDSLTFEGEVAHGPEALLEVPIRFLSVLNYGEE
ncbi:helix-turn-helix domain-containing protein [Thiohalorhabdus sp. Cl-TMA]|uniref:Helix-turn-helix domain-containing protein n=1 Tax=Thiohalorhabdus methylotrophus TaxID=3242694 RepID=A0ABV4TQE0_9GAMM